MSESSGKNQPKRRMSNLQPAHRRAVQRLKTVPFVFAEDKSTREDLMHTNTERMGQFLRVPYVLVVSKWMTFQDAVLFSFWMEWSWRKAGSIEFGGSEENPESRMTPLQKNKGWFYCPEKVVMGYLGISPKVQRETLKRLEKAGFLWAEMRYGSIRVKGRGVRPANHRWIRINYEMVRYVIRREEAKQRKRERELEAYLREAIDPSFPSGGMEQ